MLTTKPGKLRLNTHICERLGIEHPVFQAGMGWVALAELAAAVSEAGGLGVIAAGTIMVPSELQEQIRRVRILTDKPFGVDNGVLPAGQSAGLIEEVLPAGEVVRRTVDEAAKVPRWVAG